MLFFSLEINTAPVGKQCWSQQQVHPLTFCPLDVFSGHHRRADQKAGCEPERGHWELDPRGAATESGCCHCADSEPGQGQRAAGGSTQNPDQRPGDVHQLHPGYVHSQSRERRACLLFIVLSL